MTEYQTENADTRPEWHKNLLVSNSFEHVTLEDRLAVMPQQISTTHGIETHHVFRQPAKVRAAKAKRERGGLAV